MRPCGYHSRMDLDVVGLTIVLFVWFVLLAGVVALGRAAAAGDAAQNAR